MRGIVPVFAVLLLGACSCDRKPETEPAVSTVPSDQAGPVADAATTAESVATAQALAKNSANLAQAASTLHAYLAVVAGKDWTKADAYWVGGKAPPRPDDYTVRSIEDLGSMRINSKAPEALDEESPTRAVEIPVTLRVRGDGGIREINGWYRMRRKVSDDGWEITSASLQPSLD
ncbi:MAG: hypothetical protein ABWX88_06630 [Pseudoxanthomonas sp.]